jgi:hypothetical protein
MAADAVEPGVVEQLRPAGAVGKHHHGGVNSVDTVSGGHDGKIEP